MSMNPDANRPGHFGLEAPYTPDNPPPTEPTRADRPGDSQPLPTKSTGSRAVLPALLLDLAMHVQIRGESEAARRGITDDLQTRTQIGIERYGTALETANGRNALIDAYEECQDLTQYLKQRTMEYPADSRSRLAYWSALSMMIDLWGILHGGV